MIVHQVVQAATWLLALIGLVVWALWARHHPDIRLYAVPPVTWLGHALLFYSLVFMRDAGILVPASLSFMLWSSVLRLHAMILLTGFGVMLLVERIGLLVRRR